MDIRIFKLGAFDFPSLGNDAVKTAELMNALSTQGQYELTDLMQRFWNSFCNEYDWGRKLRQKLNVFIKQMLHRGPTIPRLLPAVYRKHRSYSAMTKTALHRQLSTKFPVVAFAEAVTGKQVWLPWSLGSLIRHFRRAVPLSGWWPLKQLQFVINNAAAADMQAAVEVCH